MEGREERVAVIKGLRTKEAGVIWGKAQAEVTVVEIKIKAATKVGGQVVKVEQEVPIHSKRDVVRRWEAEPVHQATGRFTEKVVQEEPDRDFGQRRDQEITYCLVR